jgi:lysophospholipase L1-like esterase
MRLVLLAVLLLSLGCEDTNPSANHSGGSGGSGTSSNSSGAGHGGGGAGSAGQSSHGGQSSGGVAGANAAEASGSGGTAAMAGGGAGASGGTSSVGGSLIGAGGEHPLPDAGCPDDGSRCPVMAVGDSITWGVTDIGFGRGGYRLPLFHLANQGSRLLTFVGSLNDATETNVTVPDMVDGVPFPGAHEGHPGWVIQQISDTIGAAVTANQPRIVLLMIGTNDMAADFDPPSAPTRLGKVLDEVARVDPSVSVVLAQITPSQDDGLNAKIETYNAAMPALVKAQNDAGHHVSLVDMYSAFKADSNYKTSLLQNTLHPNDAGYAKMAEVWYAGIEELLPKAP